ncbi:hypothetical protein [Glaciecola sp. 1036]|uniref:hypothetical protein n=1 Tax=Alteromonadaceae TaxID=72275 RepID=UPI003D08FE8F
MKNTEYQIGRVINACVELSENNKKPSVGLLKAKLGPDYKLPILIRGINRWQENPQRVDLAPKEIKTEPENKNLQQQIDDLTRRVSELEHQLSTLLTTK